MQVDFSAAFDGVNHYAVKTILALLCEAWRSCVIHTDTVSIKSIITVIVEGCWSKLVKVVSGMSHDSVWAPFVIPLVHLRAFSIEENNLISFANDFPLIYCCAIHRY